jgi:hypothetical protein
MVNKLICINCGNEIVGEPISFRNEYLCSAKCNNQYMGRLNYKKERTFKVWFDSQVLDKWIERRYWIHIDRFFGGDWVIGWSYHLGNKHFSIHFDVDGEHDYSIALCIPGIALYGHIEVPYKYSINSFDRSIGIATHHGSLSWHLWSSYGDGRENISWWRRGNFEPIDLILGRMENVREEVLLTGNIDIPMPEGRYEATYKVERYTQKRKRWFAYSYELITINIPKGIPFNDDAIYGSTTEFTTVDKAVKRIINNVNEYRDEFGMPSQQAFVERDMVVISNR